MSVDFESLIRQIQSVQTVLQQSTAHAINSGLTIRNWLIGYYIVEFEQKGNDRAQYGEKLLKNLENRLNAKGMTERRFREFRQFYITYPQIGNEIHNFLPGETIQKFSCDDEGFSIWHLPSAELKTEKWRLPTAEFKWMLIQLIVNRLSYTHLTKIFNFDNLVKRTFYEMECVKGNWSVAELERQMTPDDNPPIGLLLCTEKGNTQVKYATGGLDENIFVQKYLVELPSEEALKEYITKEIGE